MTSELKLTNPDYIFQNGVSPSMVKLWQLCHRRWYNKYIRQLKTPPTDYAEAGDLFHEFTDRRVDHPLEDCLKRLEERWPETNDTDKRNQAHLIALAKFYDKTYPLEGEAKIVWRPKEKYEGFVVEVPGMKRPLKVIVDKLVERYEGLYVYETKTGQLDKQFLKWKNDFQIYCEAYATESYMKRKCEGVIIDQVSFAKQIKRDGLLRKTITVTKDQLDYHIAWFARIANEMIDFAYANWENVEAFEIRDDQVACKAYFRACPYSDMCTYCDNQKYAVDLIKRYQQAKEEGKQERKEDKE